MDDFFEHYFNHSLRFLSYRPRSEKEVRDNLAKIIKSRKSRGKVEQVDTEVVERVIARLKEHRFLNDEEFAAWWVEQRSRSRPKGSRVIMMELKQKGVTQDIIETLLNAEDTKIQSLEGMKKLLRKQTGKVSHLPKREQKQKLGQFLLRRGFDYDTAKHAIDEVLGEGV